MKVVVFGTGSALTDFLTILPDRHEVVALCDNNAEKWGTTVAGQPVVSPAHLQTTDADLIVIASRSVDAIRQQLLGLGFPADKIVASCPSHSDALAALINADVDRLNHQLGLNLPAAGLATMYLCPEEPSAVRSRPSEDYVRRQAMRLCARWLAGRGVEGAIAELGVYQGEQAALLNALFPDRPLYLLDTFEGFAPADVRSDVASGYSVSSVGQFHDTSIDLVMSKMSSPANVHVRKGFFPDSAVEMPDVFAFVSLDVDLYEPILAGLEYFYPRLASGGFIFIHDYNNLRYKGVRHAVEKFLSHTPAAAVPLPDYAGSLILTR